MNKLFWININGENITIQKDGKGFMRRSQIKVIENGRGMLAEGLTINLDSIWNLEDGGTPFGNPVF